MLQNKLQIIIITFNRSFYLERTLSYFFDERSPVKNFDILVLDNNSTDTTAELCKKYSNIHKNLKYIKNNKNVGANANIAKAFEYLTKDYLWIVADDDLYDWSNWFELEQAIENQEKAIVISRMDLPNDYKNSIPKILTQCAFVSACIFHKSLINDTIMRNIYDKVYCLFPHLQPLVAHINNNGNFYVLDRQIIKHGSYESKQSPDTLKDDIFIRGCSEEFVSTTSKYMNFDIGFAIAIADIKDQELRCKAMQLLQELLNWRKGKRPQWKVLIKNINYSFDCKEYSFITALYRCIGNRLKPF